ncbi:unnamed protein product, partial [Rotaria sp. Silwood1]
TLENAEYYFDVERSNNQDNYLLQLNVAQVIVIFHMLGINDMNEQLKNNLVDIGLSEGKSIILEIRDCILTLFGFNVHCAIFSSKKLSNICIIIRLMKLIK